MAKELPYFKFEPSEWDNGNIQICTRDSKGLFIDLCSIYWSRLGELPYALALQKLCNGNNDALQELINRQIIHIEHDQIIIDFLDEQLSEFNQINEKRRNAANKRWKDASALQVQSKSNAIREDKIRGEEKRIDNKSFDLFWNKYDKKVGLQKSRSLWNKIPLTDHERIMKHLDEYVKTEKSFRKDPERYLKYRTWEDEIVTKNNHGGSQQWGDVEHIKI